MKTSKIKHFENEPLEEKLDKPVFSLILGVIQLFITFDGRQPAAEFVNWIRKSEKIMKPVRPSSLLSGDQSRHNGLTLQRIQLVQF